MGAGHASKWTKLFSLPGSKAPLDDLMVALFLLRLSADDLKRDQTLEPSDERVKSNLLLLLLSGTNGFILKTSFCGHSINVSCGLSGI